MVCSGAQGHPSSSPALGVQGPPSSSGDGRDAAQPDLLWLADLTGAHIGLAPISQDPEDRCSIWENLVSLVDFQCPGFPLTSEELRHYIDVPRASSSAACGAAVTVALPQAVAWSPLPPGDIDYSTNAHVKPPYSYATLICMAMQASEKPKLTLAAICKWIRDNFCYFRRAHPSWQSSIRHNLCINKRFIKVPREKGEPGRGAFWKLHPQYAEWLKNSSSKGSRTLAERVPPASSSGTAQQGAGRVLSPAASGCGSRGGLEVGAELQRLLQEFEEFESSHSWKEAEQQRQQLRPALPAEGSWLPGCAPEEPGELTELTGSADWEALLDPSLEQGDFCTLEHLQLPPPTQPGTFPLHLPGEQEQHLGWPQGQQQILPEPSPSQPGLDETLMATEFLEAAWDEEILENLSSLIPEEQGAENTQGSLGGREGTGWDSLGPLNLLEMGGEVRLDLIQ